MSFVTKAPVLDLRSVPMHARDAVIGGSFEALAAGESLEVLSDQEPRRLHAQLLQQWPGQFSWDLTQAGPAQWQIRIGRLVAAKSCCGCCGR